MGLTGPQFVEGGGGAGGKEGGGFFQGGRGCIFSTKNKLKPGIYNDKESLKQEFFFLS